MPKNMELAWLFDFYGDMLTEKQREVFSLYYEEDLSLAEIAENQNITRQGVRDSIKRAEAQMVAMEERLHLAERFSEVRQGLEEISVAAQEICRLNERYGISRDIDSRAQHISGLAEDLKAR